MGVWLALLSCGLTVILGCSLGVTEKHWRLAEQYASQGQHLRAIEEYTRVVNFGGRNTLAIRAQLQIAKTYENQLKDYTRAIRSYRDAQKRSDDRRIKMEAMRAVANIYAQRLGEPNTAAEEYRVLFEEYAKSEPEGADVLIEWAKTLSDAGRFSETVVLLDRFLSLYPGHRESPRVLLDRGHALLADRRPDLAIGVFQGLIERFRDVKGYENLVSEAFYGLGSGFEANGDWTAALEAFRQALATYPNRRVIELKIDGLSKRKKERQISL